MDLNTTLVAAAVPNGPLPLDDPSQLTGWTPSDNTRGSINILWSCCLTITLCCWVSTFPNVPSLNDKWFHPFIDKFNLACVGMLGPDFLFGIAIGQLSSAWRSVKSFRELERPDGCPTWSLVHGFFADMGGFLLSGPDYPPFPVNSEQLHYLIKHGHVEFPNLTKLDIEAYNKTDTLSKAITFWQVLWFSVSELHRVRQGLPMTTFELTALSYSITMMLAQLCWFYKPTISRPTVLHPKNGLSIESIRAAARATTHRGLPQHWYRTPLDFVSPSRRFLIDVHWTYYEQLTYMVYLPFFSREITARPWDRLPYGWQPIERALLGPAFVVLVAFSLSLVAAWNFHFPTEGEKIAWRVCSIYHGVFSVLAGLYYIWLSLRCGDGGGGGQGDPEEAGVSCSVVSESVGKGTEVSVVPTGNNPPTSQSYHVEAVSVSPKQPRRGVKGVVLRGVGWLKTWRNISPDGDPGMTIGLRAAFFPLAGTFLYIFSRTFFYVEDFASIRQQPVGVYTTTPLNEYIPFIS